MYALKTLARNAIPKSVRRGFKRLFYSRFKKGIRWEYAPESWSVTEQRDPDIKGWNVATVLEAYKGGLPLFRKHIRSTAPLGIWYEGRGETNNNTIPHNTHMSYAYALLLASRMRKRISMLDWGGGVGHYYEFSKVLDPQLEIEYHYRDLPIASEYVRSAFPEAHVYTDDSCLNRTYDFILATAVIHYMQDWRATIRKLAQATGGYVYFARVPIIQHNPTFMFVQRPYDVGFNTEYLGWCINRSEFLECAKDAGLVLVREFALAEAPEVEGAPEQNEYRGFLFRPASASATAAPTA